MKERVKIIQESMVGTIGMIGRSVKIDTGKQIKGQVIHVQIEMIGDSKGYIIMEMPESYGYEIANGMLMGMMTVNSLDDMCKSVLGEMCNMVSGGICTSLSQVGIISDIKPPVVDMRLEALNGSKAFSIEEADGKYINILLIFT